MILNYIATWSLQVLCCDLELQYRVQFYILCSLLKNISKLIWNYKLCVKCNFEINIGRTKVASFKVDHAIDEMLVFFAFRKWLVRCIELISISYKI